MRIRMRTIYKHIIGFYFIGYLYVWRARIRMGIACIDEQQHLKGVP